MGIDDSVNKALNIMHSRAGVDKGDPGEVAVFALMEEFYRKWGGILYWSYKYLTDNSQAGNIKMNRGNNPPTVYIENLSTNTEIDLLYVSPLRVFVLEVKAYKSKKIEVYDNRIDGVYKDEKSPVHQNEMHCRHLYSRLFRGLPNGDENYVVPIVVFTDEATIYDFRSDWQKQYILIRTLDTLAETITQYNEPLDYRLNLTLIDNLLKEGMVSCRTQLPIRY